MDFKTFNMTAEVRDSQYEDQMVQNYSNEDDQSPVQKEKTKRAYQHIELWKRKELVEKVSTREETMKDWSKRLGINYCTAKHILKIFRRTGSIETDLMKKKKEKEEELRQRVLNDSQFADYAMNQYVNPKIEKTKGSSSKNSSTKDICEFQNYEGSYENCQSSFSGYSKQYWKDVNMMNSQVYYQPEYQSYSYNSGYLFEWNNMNSQQFVNYEQVNLMNQVPNVWSFLGDLVYAKHSLI